MFDRDAAVRVLACVVGIFVVARGLVFSVPIYTDPAESLLIEAEPVDQVVLSGMVDGHRFAGAPRGHGRVNTVGYLFGRNWRQRSCLAASVVSSLSSRWDIFVDVFSDGWRLEWPLVSKSYNVREKVGYY